MVSTRALARPFIRKSLALGGASLLVLSGASALAQEASTPAEKAPIGTAPAPADQLEDIVVTARRVNENVQTTPVSVSAVSATEIQNLNIVRLESIQQLAPNLTVISNGPSSVAPVLYIRGIGSNSVALYSEPPVAIYIDGVYTPRPTQAAMDLPDLDGAEVLRGPQGTLFGRNTTGGAILLKTQTPRQEAGLQARLSYGSDNDIIASGVLHSGELGDSGIRAKVVLQSHDRDGWVEFPGLDDDEAGGSLHSYGGSLTLEKTFGDNFTINNAFTYNKLRSAVGWQTIAASAAATAYFSQTTALGGPPFLVNVDPLDITYRFPGLVPKNEARIRTIGDRLTLSYDGGDAFHLKSITGWSKIDENLTGQLGGSYVLGRVNRLGATVVEPVITHVTPDGPGLQRQFSQEFNATGTFGDLSYVAGLYYFRERVGETIRTIQIGLPAVATGAATLTDRSVIYSGVTKSYAGYGQLSWKPSALDQKLELTGGIRFTDDKKEIASLTRATSSATGVTTITGTSSTTGLAASGTTGIVPSTGKDSWKNTGWLASISYEATDDIFLFARASSAFRAGGFNSASTNAPPYDPEKAKTYEIGFKSEFLDRRLRFNATAFHTDYQNLQVNQYFGPPRNTNFIQNAGSARFRGFELEATALLGAGFQIDADYGHISPKYKTYTIGASPLPAVCTTSPNDPSCFQNAAATAHFPYLATTTYHVGLQWAGPETGIGTLTLRGDYGYRSSARLVALDFLAPNAQFFKTGAQKDLSARIILSDIPIGNGDTKFKLQAFADNLLNHRYYVYASDFSTTFNGIFNRPRNYGLILSADF